MKDQTIYIIREGAQRHVALEKDIRERFPLVADRLKALPFNGKDGQPTQLGSFLVTKTVTKV